MKKSNKLTVFYILTSVSLFLIMLIGGVYGVYVSVGLNFVRNTVPNTIGDNGVSNVSFGGNLNYSPSMAGIIFLSIILSILSIFDFIALIKQIVFFKQFKAIKKSRLTKKIEKKSTSKGAVIFWTFFIDVISFIVGVVGIFINAKCFVRGNEMSWLFYLIDSLVSILSLLSIILLIAKLKNKTELKTGKRNYLKNNLNVANDQLKTKNKKAIGLKDMNQMEYNLLKLDSMKKSKIVSDEEYKKLRRDVLNFGSLKNSSKEFQEDH